MASRASGASTIILFQRQRLLGVCYELPSLRSMWERKKQATNSPWMMAQASLIIWEYGDRWPTREHKAPKRYTSPKSPRRNAACNHAPQQQKK